MMLADDDFLAAPAAGEIRRQLTADTLVQLEEKTLVEWTIVQRALANRVLRLFDAARKVRCKFSVAQDAERRVEVAGGCVRRLSSASSIASSTGSPSKAMLRATLRGRFASARRCCSAGDRLRQCLMASIQFMARIV